MWEGEGSAWKTLRMRGTSWRVALRKRPNSRDARSEAEVGREGGGCGEAAAESAGSVDVAEGDLKDDVAGKGGAAYTPWCAAARHSE